MIRLADLLSDIASEHGYYYNSSADTNLDSDTTNKPRQKYLKRRINEAYLEILGYIPPDFLRTELPIKVPRTYTTGIVWINSGELALGAAGTRFTRYMQGRQILISGDKRPYFLKTYTSDTQFDIAKAYAEATAAAASYTIGVWALIMPSDFLAPVERDAIVHYDNGVPIQLVDRERFRRLYPTVYSTGTPTICCIDGYSPVSRITDTGDVTNGSTTITFDNYTPRHEDIGRKIRLEGDSIFYTIYEIDSGAGTVEVNPAVQRATADPVDIDIDPAPLPLLWFNYASTSDLPIVLRYTKKPEYLWTDEQRAQLPGEFVTPFTNYAKYLATQYLSRDRMKKSEAFNQWQLSMAQLPRKTGLAILLKGRNLDTYRRDYGYATGLPSFYYNKATEMS